MEFSLAINLIVTNNFYYKVRKNKKINYNFIFYLLEFKKYIKYSKKITFKFLIKKIFLSSGGYDF